MRIIITIAVVLSLTSCVTTEYTDAKGGITKTKRMDAETAAFIARAIEIYAQK